jgi:peptidyl-prolyl cis-trans isomerase SurA
MSFKRNIISSLYPFGLAFLLLQTGNTLCAQEVADKIIAVVGRNRIILQSDIEMQYQQMKQQNPDAPEFASKCEQLRSAIIGKMMQEQAERDSVRVTDEDVEGQLENRLRYFTQLYGSKERLEQASGKTIFQMKEEYRDMIREQMIMEKMQSQVFEHVKITPAEVDAFFKKIPVDSLPFLPATVEVGQIVIDPKASAELDAYAKEKLEGIKKEILAGSKTFEQAAGIYSEDPGSRDNGGRYDGITRNGAWAAEFITATFKLQNPGDISPVIKTRFGYHIIQLIQRRGDEADVRHILVRPQTVTSDFNKALERLDSIRNILVSGKMAFPEAVGKYSTDEAAKRTGGMISDPTSGSSDLDISKLDPGMVLLLDSLKVGDFSRPHIFVTDARERSCRIVYLRDRTMPHKANLKDDYGKIMEIALGQKKMMRLSGWVTSKLPTVYLWVAPEYKNCTGMKDWIRDEAR